MWLFARAKGATVCSFRVGDHEGVGTILLLPGESRRLDLVLGDSTEKKVFHHTARAAVLENLPRIAPLETLKNGLVDFHSWR
jgi:hypothetical protein